MLKRLVPKLRATFLGARIRMPLDSGFNGAELYDFFEAQNLR
jgi:hypothetical protein